jgi:hypothetical protein
MEWRPIFKQGSLPYNEGERFLARINECSCGTEEVNVNKCLQSRPCIRDFLVVNEFNFFYVKDTGRRARSTSYSKGGIITRYKKWKMIYPDIGKREDVFVCTCSDIAVLRCLKDHSKNDDTQLECCHCRNLLKRCSESCINYQRGR